MTTTSSPDDTGRPATQPLEVPVTDLPPRSGARALATKAERAGCTVRIHRATGPWMTLEQANTVSVSMTRAKVECDESCLLPGGHDDPQLAAQVIYVERPTGWKAELIQQRLATGGLLTLETLSELAL